MQNKRKSYIHCSWDIVTSDFVPRIPSSRIGNSGSKFEEDSVTPRICIAKTVEGALRAMPQTGKIIANMRLIGLPVIVHAYYLSADARNVYIPTADKVPDARNTGELWLLEPPEKAIRRDYLITDEFIHKTKDQDGRDYEQFIGCNFTQIKFQDNLENLVKILSDSNENLDQEAVQIMKGKVSFRTLMQNMDAILFEDLKFALQMRLKKDA